MCAFFEENMKPVADAKDEAEESKVLGDDAIGDVDNLAESDLIKEINKREEAAKAAAPQTGKKNKKKGKGAQGA